MCVFCLAACMSLDFSQSLAQCFSCSLFTPSAYSLSHTITHTHTHTYTHTHTSLSLSQMDGSAFAAFMGLDSSLDCSILFEPIEDKDDSKEASFVEAGGFDGWETPPRYSVYLLY